MSPKADEDWSDSDEEVGSDEETAVQLGIPDGPMDASADLLDANVSRIGGHPAFLTMPEPPCASALCKNCSKPMKLLVQVWCPLENSPYDRALYIWGCASGLCQRKDGSIRAWRGLRYNKKYAGKLSKKLARQKMKAEQEANAAEAAAQKKNVTKTNPFSLKSVGPSNPFAPGAEVFGAAHLGDVSQEPKESNVRQEPTSTSSDHDGTDDEESEESDEDEDAEELAERMAAAKLENSEWTSAPAYAPLYLSTVSEYLPPASKTKVPSRPNLDADDEDRKGKGGGWALEGYENSVDVDHAFERFTKRVSYEGEQCLRYELGGTPLPFSSDKVFNSLFPAPPSPYIPVTKREFTVVPALKRTYNPSALPPCTHCNSRRVFECQLMPNLINVLKRPSNMQNGSKKQTDEERRQEVLRELKGGQRVGMEWGTCMIFSCEKDCSVEGKGCWREEVVLAQWDA